jgi:hypothetical protein
MQLTHPACLDRPREMRFILYARKNGQALQHELETQRAAPVIASALMRQGVTVERILCSDGHELDAETIRRLAEAL